MEEAQAVSDMYTVVEFLVVAISVIAFWFMASNVSIIRKDLRKIADHLGEKEND